MSRRPQHTFLYYYTGPFFPSIHLLFRLLHRHHEKTARHPLETPRWALICETLNSLYDVSNPCIFIARWLSPQPILNNRLSVVTSQPEVAQVPWLESFKFLPNVILTSLIEDQPREYCKLIQNPHYCFNKEQSKSSAKIKCETDLSVPPPLWWTSVWVPIWPYWIR